MSQPVTHRSHKDSRICDCGTDLEAEVVEDAAGASILTGRQVDGASRKQQPVKPQTSVSDHGELCSLTSAHPATGQTEKRTDATQRTEKNEF